MFGDMFGGPARGGLSMFDDDLPKAQTMAAPTKPVAQRSTAAASAVQAPPRLTSSFAVSSASPSKLSGPGVSTNVRRSKSNKYSAEIPISKFEGRGHKEPDLITGARPPMMQANTKAAPTSGGSPQARTHGRPSPEQLAVAQIHSMQANLQTAAAAKLEAKSRTKSRTRQGEDDAGGDAGAASGADAGAASGGNAQSMDAGTVQTLINWRPPNQVEYVEHPYQAIAATQIDGSLTTTTIGTLCRFTGYAPLTGCPEEAPNGCVDREGCSRTCEEDGYFHWRCKGPQMVAADSLDNQEPEVTDTGNNEAAVAALATQLEAALTNQDYSHLARVIMEKGGNSVAAAFSAAAKHTNLAQKASAAKQARDLAVAMQKQAVPTTLAQKPQNVLVPSYKPAETLASSPKPAEANTPAKAKDAKKPDTPKAQPEKKAEIPQAKPAPDASIPAPPVRLQAKTNRAPPAPMTEGMKQLLGKAKHLRA